MALSGKHEGCDLNKYCAELLKLCSTQAVRAKGGH